MATRTASPPSSAPVAARIPQLPALDGLRAVAVVAVLLWHAEVGFVRGGFLGVESFFVVSGYLITALLWSERAATGRISLRGFWMRRARRLLPALYLLLVVVMAALLMGWRDVVARARGDAVAAAVYVSNWYQLLSKQSYFAEAGRPSPFKHLWSLAVEEQFYVLWPLLLLGLVLVWRGDRVRVAATVVALAVTSDLAMAVTFALRHDPKASVPYDPSRLYYGLDTRAGGLLLGCALALVWRPWERPGRRGAPSVAGRRPPRWVADVAAGAGLAVLLGLFWRLGDDATFVYLGGLQLVAVATALVIFGVTWRGSVLSGVLGARPLVEVGRRSYSLYLWHWPVYVVTRPGLDVPWSSGPTLALRLALSAGLAEVSYRFVEVPLRRGALGRGWRRVQANARLASPPRRRQLRRSWGAIGAGTLSLVLLLGVAAATTAAPPPLDSLLSTDGAAGPADDTLSGPAGPLVPLASGVPAKVHGSALTTVPARGDDPARIPVTDVAAAASPGSGGGGVQVVAIGDSVMLGARTALTDAVPGIAVNAKVGRYMSEGRAIVAALAARDALPGAIVVHLGTNGPAAEEDVQGIIAAAGGRPVVFVTVKAPRRWESTSNSSITDGAAGQPNVRIVDWKKASGRCKGSDIFYGDGIHLKPAGAACYATLIRAALA